MVRKAYSSFFTLISSLALTGALVAAEEANLRQQVLDLNDINGEGPIKGQIKALAEDPAGAKKLIALAVTMSKEKDQPLNYNAAWILGRVSSGLKDLEAGKVFYPICADQALKLKSSKKIAEAYLGWIEILQEHKKYDESEKVCKEVLELKEEDSYIKALKYLVHRRMILALTKQQKFEDSMKLVDNLVKSRPDDWQVYQLKGYVHQEAGQFAEAAKTYEEVLTKITKDKTLDKSEQAEESQYYRYLLSGVYVDLKQIDKAAEHLQTLLKEKPNDPSYNNDLGYIWADHDKNLEEAEKLIRRAIDEERKQRKAKLDLKPEDDKDNAAYLDSLGWVLFKQKKYKDAKAQLLEAIKDPKNGQHSDIYDHLADVHLALGEKAEALAALKKALELAGTSKRDKERKAQVEKKLKENQ